jgi:hypothetical protein
VRAREVDVRVRVEDQELLVAVDPHGEPAPVALARLPGERLAANGEDDPSRRRLLDLGKRRGDLPYRVPARHEQGR